MSCNIRNAYIHYLVFLIVPYVTANNYSELFGVLTTEATYAIDLGVLCPGLIICALLISSKIDIGYKTAPIFHISYLALALWLSCSLYTAAS